MELAAREAAPAHLLVKIEQFSLLDKCGIDKYKTKEFVAGNYKWRLLISPNWHGTGKAGDSVSVYLAISGTESLPKNWEVNAVFSIFILNQISNKYLYTPGKSARFFALQTEFGFTSFISKIELTSPSNGYMIDDCCLFGAEVFVNDNKVVTECFSMNDEPFLCKHVIKISDFSTLKNVWHSEEFTAGGYKWKIALNVKDNSVKTEDGLHMCLMYVAAADICGDRVRASSTICIKNQLSSDKNCKVTVSDWFDASNLYWDSDFGLPCLKISELNDANSGFVVKDTLLLEVEISVQAVAW